MSPRIQWRHQYDQDTDDAIGDATRIVNEQPTKTIVSFKEDADINVMMKRFGVTDGAIPPAVADPRYYGDFSDVVDFRGALEQTRAAQHAFDQLPANIRNRFYGDPTKLWEFVNDEKNFDEAVAIGLLQKRPMPEPTEPQPERTDPPK